MLTEVSIVARVLRSLIPVLLVVGPVVYGTYLIYQAGDRAGEDRTMRAWQADIIAKNETHELELRELRKRAAAMVKQTEEDNRHIEGVYSEKIQKLTADINKLRNRGLFITATACSDRGAREAEGTGVGGKTPGRIRLPEEVERGLSRIVEDAQTVVAQYESCRTRLKQIADVTPDSGLVFEKLY